MTPNSFEFTVSLPGDARFLKAVSQLATQSADYAQLPADTGAELAGEVERAAATAIGRAAGGPIEIVFSGSDTAVTVTISCTSSADAPHPTSSGAEGISVEWTSSMGRHVCHIRQRIPA
jgi:hypothetical protein